MKKNKIIGGLIAFFWVIASIALMAHLVTLDSPELGLNKSSFIDAFISIFGVIVFVIAWFSIIAYSVIVYSKD